jgi:electron transport complex protein RnfC
MKPSTFSGGLDIHAPSRIDTVQIEPVPEPKQVTLPLKQHQGAPCRPLVKKGDAVVQGEIIAESATAAILAPISGTVLEVSSGYKHLSGDVVPAVKIGPAELAEDKSKKGKKDSKKEPAEPAPPREPNLVKLDELRTMGKILKTGLVDASARFAPPLLEKIRTAQQHKISTLIINGLDEFNIQGCQASLLSDSPEEVLTGIHALQHMLNPRHVLITVYENIYQSVTSIPQDDESFHIVPLKAKHPQHVDELLVKAVTKQEYPPEMTPEDLGVSIISLQTAFILGWVLKTNQPFLDTYVSVAGGVLDRPRNLRIRVGTPIREVLQFLGLSEDIPSKIVHGGPMSGTSLYDLDTPVTKETGQLYIQGPEEIIAYSSKVCVKCGFCVQVCPMRLMPFMLSGFSEAGSFELAAKYDIFSCIECGCCAFVCPSQIPMVQWIKFGKSALMSDRSDHDEFTQACRLA